MERSFTMTRAEVVDCDAATLRASIVEAVGSEAGADSILRSLERIGHDGGIESFEMIEVTGGRRRGGAAAAWRVRADRGTAQPDS
ncbi:MAG TPA: hypothetical protein VK929_00130 [Longimicrobiales bacterium]|nr:hypothetical protein [Longimicrobiales bacterium]